jgi:hypothetical protein
VFKFDVPKSVTGVDAVSVTNVRELQRRLKALDPLLRRQLIRDAKEPAKPIQTAVKNAIQDVTPLSGMTRGRLNWNAAVDRKGKTHKPQDVAIQFRTSTSGRSKITSLVRVRVQSPAVTFVATAGSSNRFIDAGYKGSGFTKEYPWKNGTRRHKVNGQGRMLVEKMASRMQKDKTGIAWPAAVRMLPEAKAKVDATLTKFAKMVNMKGI